MDLTTEISALFRENDTRKHILFVDDDGAQLRRMKEMIPSVYRVSIATTGMQALSLISWDRPDLIFLDYEMPQMDGKATLERIRSEKSAAGIPVVFLTGMCDRKHIQSVLDLDPDGYIVKPSDRETLMEFIHKLIDPKGAAYD